MNPYRHITPINLFDSTGLAANRGLRELVNETTGSVSWNQRTKTATVTIDGKTQYYVVDDIGAVHLNGNRVGFLENDRIIVWDESFYNDFQIVGELTIYAYYDPEDPRGTIYAGDFTTGHSWIGYQNFGADETTYGTWPESPTTRHGLNINNSWKRDSRYSNFTTSYTKKITKNQRDRMYNSINNGDDWNYINNCTTFAVRTFNATTGYFWIAITPLALHNLINSLK